MRCPPRSGGTTNRKCLFASIFLNVNCEGREVKGDTWSPRLSESHLQSYCSLEKNDAKHSLKPIFLQTPEELSSQSFGYVSLLCRVCVSLMEKPPSLCCFSCFPAQLEAA